MAEWIFFFFSYQMFVSGAAFTVYGTAPVTLWQWRLAQPLFLLLVLFGYDWIFHSLMELPHALGSADMSRICSYGSNSITNTLVEVFDYFLRC